MKMAKVATFACDNCGRLPANTVLVALDAQPEVEVDLCEECKEALLSFLRNGRVVKPTKVYRRFSKTTDFEV